MKKFYFLGALMSLMMLVSLPLSAQVESVVDLYGKYKFTSELTVTEAGKDYSDMFKAESGVTISKDDKTALVWDALITGIGGSTQNYLTVNGIDTETCQFKIQNWDNNNQLWANFYISNGEGIYPFGEVGRGDLMFTYNAETMGITIPDFTVVSCDHANSAATVMASFKNCKLTLVESEKIEIPNIEGSWHATPAGTYGSMEGSEYPSEYNFALTKVSEDSKKHTYNLDLTIEGFPTVQTTATFNGTTLDIVLDSLLLDKEKNIYACSQWGNLTATVDYSYLSETTLTMGKALCIGTPVTEKTEAGTDTTYVKLLQWWMNGNAKKEVPASEKFDWSGTWNVKVDNPAENLLVFDGSTFPSEFQMVISYSDVTETYYVEEFLGYNNKALTYGGIPLNPSADDSNVAELTTGKLIATVEPGKLYWKLYDGLGNTGTIKFTANEDGSISIGDFFVKTLNYETNEETPSAFYQYSIKATKEEVKPFDFVGKFTIKATPSPVLTDYDYPSEFGIEIQYNETTEKYYVTTFLSNDIYRMNNGGIPCEREGDVLKISTGDNRYVRSVGNNEDYTIMWYDSFFEPEGKGSSFVTLTGNADGTVTLGDFDVYRTTINYDASWNATKTSELACKYTAATGTTGIESIVVAPTNNGAMGVYTLSGVRVADSKDDLNALPGGIYIVKDGQKSVKVIR